MIITRLNTAVNELVKKESEIEDGMLVMKAPETCVSMFKCVLSNGLYFVKAHAQCMGYFRFSCFHIYFYLKIELGRNADTRQLGILTISLILKSTATLHSIYASSSVILYVSTKCSIM